MLYAKPSCIMLARREELGMTQRDVGFELGLDDIKLIPLMERDRIKVPLPIMIDIAHVLRIETVWFVDKVLRDRQETIPLASWLFGRRGLLRAEYVSSSRSAESVRRGETPPSSEPMPETKSVEQRGSEERDAGDAERAGESETDDIDDAALQEPRGDDQPAQAGNEVVHYRLEGTLNISTRRPTDKSKT